MTLLWLDGQDLGDNATRYALRSGGAASTTTAFSYGRSWNVGTGNFGIDYTASSEVIVGARINLVSAGDITLSFRGDAGATTHISIVVRSDGSVEARRGSSAGTLLASVPAGTLTTLGAWNYFEARVTISDTVGTVKVRVNGSTTDLLSFTGDTRNGGTNLTTDRFYFLGNASTNLVDDFYLCNTAGSTNNTWLGDVRVFTLMPNGNGASSQLVGSDGNSTDNYLLVDEQPPSSADYVGSGTAGQRDTYAMENLPGTVSAVLGTQQVIYAAKSDAGAASMKQVVRSGGTNYAGSSIALSTSYAFYRELRETDPATSAAWTASNVNAAEVGVEVA